MTQGQSPGGPPTTPTPTPTPSGQAAAQSLIDVHDELRHELAQVRVLVAEVVDGVREIGSARAELHRLSVRRHDWTTAAYCSAHCLTVAQHHYGEDHEIFPVLRRANPSLAPVLERLEQEHVTIHDLLERIDASLVALVNGAGSAKADLTRVLEHFAETLLAHLRYEEDQLLEPMAVTFG